MTTTKKSNVLTEVDVVEVSLVDRGANMKRIALLKQEKNPVKMTDAQKATLAKLLSGITIGKVPEKISKAMEGMSEQGRQAVLSAVGLLAAARGDLPDGLLQSVLEACGIESPDDLIDLISPAAPAAAEEPTVEASAETPPPTTEDPMTTPQKSAAAAVDNATKEQIAKAEKDLAASQATIALLTKQAATEKERAEKLEKAVATERDARLNKEYLTKAEKLSGLPTKAAELGPILKALNDASPDLAAKVEKALEAANTKIAELTKLFTEKGFTAPAGDEAPALEGSKGAMGAIEKVAAELRKADDKLTVQQSVLKAMEQNPALYAAYRAEHKAEAKRA